MLVQSERRMHSGVPNPQSSAAALLFAFFRASLLLFSFALRFPRCWFPLSTNEKVEIPNEILKKSRSQNGQPDSHLSSTTTLREVKMRNPIPICPQWLLFEESKLCGVFFVFLFPMLWYSHIGHHPSRAFSQIWLRVSHQWGK